MRSVPFGNTWWGKKWLDALTGVDFDNRLPRGMRYARNGSVETIKFADCKVLAEVSGSRPYPYNVRISLPSFSATEKKAIVAAATQNPLILSQLLVRSLPPALYETIEKEKIPLFPKHWDDISAFCSCPDWAMCCKHIAAVFYLIANEIDKNPFLLFDLHDFDIFHALEKKGYAIEEQSTVAIPSAAQLISSKKSCADNPLPQEKRDTLLDTVDFTQIPPSTDNLLSLLSDRPLFYPQKDFKQLLERALDTWSRESTKETSWIKNSIADVDAAPNDIFTGMCIQLSPNLELSTLELRLANRTICAKEKHEAVKLLRRLSAIPPKSFHSQPDGVTTLCLLVHFALKTIEQGAIVPELLATSDGHRIRWVPALINPKVAELFETICALAPNRLVEQPHLDKNGQIKSLLSIIIGLFVFSYKLNLGRTNDEITSLFFEEQNLKAPKKFEEEQVAESIALWLSRLYIARKDFVPIVKFDETDRGISLELLVENSTASTAAPIPLKKILKLKKYARAKYDVLKDICLLADYIPEIATFVASSGLQKPEIPWADFEEVLFRQLPLLKLLSVPVLLPKGLHDLVRPKVSAVVSQSSSDTSKSYLSLDDLLDFDWQVAIGDEMVSAQEFRKLVKGLNGIVKIKDQFVYIDENEINNVLKTLESPPQLTPKETIQSVLAAEYDGTKLQLSDGVKRMIEEMLHAPPLATPDGLQAKLRDYQKRGYDWLVRNAHLGFGSLIADDMGLGKTVQVIALLLKLRNEGRLDDSQALVVVPATLLTNWQRECEKFAPSLNVHVYHGANRTFGDADTDVVLTTYSLTRQDESRFLRRKWEAIIIDEAQAIKNSGTAQTRSVKKIKAPIRIAMTGTPVENRLTEYWSIFDFLNRGYLKGIKSFRQEFALPIEVDRDRRKLEQFRKITAPFILRRLKSDKSIVKDLPDKLEFDQYCQLAKRQAALYQSTMDLIMDQIDKAEDIERRGLVLKLITSLKQICNHPSHFLKKTSVEPDYSGKAALLISLLQSIQETDEKVLIFTQYTEMGRLLQKMIVATLNSHPLFLHGGLSLKKRDTLVDTFQTEPWAKILILSLKAGGTGLNLTSAQNVVHFDLWWNPAVEAQATDRAYRIGQKRDVMVHRLITRGTFEEKINTMIQDKRELADLTIGSGEKWIGDYSNKDLRELFSLT